MRPGSDLIRSIIPGGSLEPQALRVSDTLVAVALPVVLDGKSICIVLVHSQADKSQPERRVKRDVASAAAPLVDCLCRELGSLGGKALKSATLSQRTEELEWLFALTESLHSNSDDPKAINQLLGAAVERMRCCFGAVVVPEHGLSLTYASLARIDVQAGRAFERLGPYFMNYVTRRKEPLVANKVSTTDKMPPFKLLLVPIEPHKGRIIGYIVFLNPIASSDFGRRQLFLGRHLGQQIGALLESQYDLATGLLTRRAFEQQVKHHLSSDTGECMHSLIYFDIDGLHVINDTAGFERGDEAIARVADLLRPPSLPENAIACRLGGDSFIVVVPDHDADHACARAQTVLTAATELAIGPAAQRLAITLSCGVVRLYSLEGGIGDPLAAAQLACKSAKEHGGNRAEIYRDVDDSMMRRRRDVLEVGNLRNALAEGRFHMYGQKIVSANDTSQVRGIECLLRMTGQDGEIVSPDVFLPSAHRYQMMQTIDAWVISNALREIAPYRSVLLEAHISVAINISGQSVQDEAFVEAVERALLESKVAPGIILFEITETAAISNLARAERLIRKLRRHGCGFALDDFGTGVNSLTYLKCLPITCVKIDGSFTQDLLSNNRSDVVVQTIVRMAKSLGIECIAECVESTAVAKRLREFGVDHLQGYYAHKPEPLRETLQTIKNDESQRLRQLFLLQ